MAYGTLISPNRRTGTTNDEISKNFSIAHMADALREYAKDYAANQNPTTAKLSSALAFADRITDTKDEDVKRVYEILKSIESSNSNRQITVRTW